MWGQPSIRPAATAWTATRPAEFPGPAHPNPGPGLGPRADHVSDLVVRSCWPLGAESHLSGTQRRVHTHTHTHTHTRMLTWHPHMHTYTHNLDRHTLTHPCAHIHPDMSLTCTGVHTHTQASPPPPDTQSHLRRFHCRRSSPDLQSPPQPASDTPGASARRKKAEKGLGFTLPSPQAVCPALTGKPGPQR